MSEVIDGPGHAPGLGRQLLGVGWGWGWWASHALHCAIPNEALEPWPSRCCHGCGPRPPARGPAGRPASGPLPLDSSPRRSGGRLGHAAPGIRRQPHVQAVGCGELIPLGPIWDSSHEAHRPEPEGPSRRPSSGPGPGLTAARLLPATAITTATPWAAEPRAEGRVTLVATHPLRPSVSSLSKRQAPPRGSEQGERPHAAETVRRVGVGVWKCVN